MPPRFPWLRRALQTPPVALLALALPLALPLAASRLSRRAGSVAPNAALAAPPTDNPAARYRLPWTDRLPWKRVVSLAQCDGATDAERLQDAQRRLGDAGGVIYFPPGDTTFPDDITLKDHILLRGAPPVGATDARDERFTLPSRITFPRYRPVFTGEGTPKASAFKVIRLERPESASGCGVVNLAINRGRIVMAEGDDHAVGKNRLVLGCILTNAVDIAKRVPDLAAGQRPWQRFTEWHAAAIQVASGENALIARNRLPEGQPDDFTMDGYILKDRASGPRAVNGVVFDTNNRPGIDLNGACLGGAGGSPPEGTPQTHPWGFRRGGVLRDNYIYATGRTAIAFTGDGTVCQGNVIRFRPNVTRWTNTGVDVAYGSSTNDNRAVQMRGWRWTVADNDYLVYKNRLAGSPYSFNDGEGLMHEDHCNSIIRDSRLLRNKGNAYLSLFRTAGIDGLLVEGNDISTDGGIEAIYVDADRTGARFPCRNVIIRNNVTRGSGILIRGEPASRNRVEGNRHEGDGGSLTNAAHAVLRGNIGYTVSSEERKR